MLIERKSCATRSRPPDSKLSLRPLASFSARLLGAALESLYTAAEPYAARRHPTQDLARAGSPSCARLARRPSRRFTVALLDEQLGSLPRRRLSRGIASLALDAHSALPAQPLQLPGLPHHLAHRERQPRIQSLDPLCTELQHPFAPPPRAASGRPPWLNNRSIVLFGSSVDRWHLVYFCELAGGQLEIIDPAHPMSPLRLPEGFLKPGQRIVSGAQPHICRLEEYGLQLVFVFHYGLELDDHWASFGRPEERLEHHWTPPGSFEARLADLLLPLLASLEIITIDVLEVSSYEWDLALWQQTSLLRNSGAELHLQDGWDVHLPFYLQRLQQVANVVLDAFPHPRPILWRVPHLSGRDDPAPRYAAAMERATRFVVAEGDETISQGFELDETGAMLAGGAGSAWMGDHTHPAKIPHAVVWCDFILWRLRKSVTGEV